MKIAFLGGSFNPIHKGHLSVANVVLNQLEVDKFLFIPAYVSPFKQNNLMASPTDRINMINLAIKEYKKMEIDTFEINKKGVSYTIETVEYLNQKYNEKPYLIIGDDLLKDFHNWKEYSRLKDLVDLVVLNRLNDQEIDSIKKDLSLKCIFINNTLFKESSTDIRDFIKDKKSIQNLVSDSVYRYIVERKLYGINI